MTNQLHVAECLPLASHCRLLLIMVRAPLASFRYLKKLLKGALALTKQEMAKIAISADCGLEPRIGFKPHAKVRVHGHEMVLLCRLLEDLPHQQRHLPWRPDPTCCQLLVQRIKLLHRELVQDGAHCASHHFVLAVLRPRRPHRPAGLRRASARSKAAREPPGLGLRDTAASAGARLGCRARLGCLAGRGELAAAASAIGGAG
mmetsp:Transcript_190/g.472  ORF Transcript_190/g.472 Transcript_190/m.472 type:complete len:203 (+) Transcript_190:1171-1779(+)